MKNMLACLKMYNTQEAFERIWNYSANEDFDNDENEDESQVGE